MKRADLDRMVAALPASVRQVLASSAWSGSGEYLLCQAPPAVDRALITRFLVAPDWWGRPDLIRGSKADRAQLRFRPSRLALALRDHLRLTGFGEQPSPLPSTTDAPAVPAAAASGPPEPPGDPHHA